MTRIGVVDTTFARVDMAKYVIRILEKEIPGVEIIRYTVPGLKDIPVATRKLLIDEKCDGAITLGWVGADLTDKFTYLATSIGLIMLQILTGKHVIDVTVHEDEAKDEKELYDIAIDRAVKHALNLVNLLKYGREALSKFAGKGLRQGKPDVGPIIEE
ncbi:MAG: riboflavin synthase [Desulfurococcaceae archaeon]|uniref:Riboflavin synthase n=1 Tax=Staphylothermus marinus TaxID=2280 RepID=A0A7C4JL57_STAMA